MNILCWDTCTETVSVTLLTPQGHTTHAQAKETHGGPATFLAPIVQTILKEASLKMSDIDRLGLTVGPGSLTGIRQGISFARGLTFLKPWPVYGISLFQLWADSLREENDPLIFVVDTFGAHWAVQVYEKEAVFLEVPLLISKKSFPDWLQQKTHDGRHILILPGMDNQEKIRIQKNSQFNLFDFQESYSFLLAQLIQRFPLKDIPHYPLTPFYIHPPVSNISSHKP